MSLFQSRSGESGPREYFRLEQLQEEFDFATDADLAANRRFQMLSLRDREVAEFRNIKMIAPFEREIPRDAFAVSFFLASVADFLIWNESNSISATHNGKCFRLHGRKSCRVCFFAHLLKVVEGYLCIGS